jgi:hypothetical protein
MPATSVTTVVTTLHFLFSHTKIGSNNDFEKHEHMEEYSKQSFVQTLRL